MRETTFLRRIFPDAMHEEVSGPERNLVGCGLP
jgi:hypothetical protein